MHEDELNLIPVDILEHEALKERLRFWTLFAIGCLVFLTSINILLKIINNSISDDISTLKSMSKKLSLEVAELKQFDAREKELLRIRDKIYSLSQKGPMIEIFAAIDKSINNNVTLTHLEAKYNYPAMSEDKEESEKKGYFSKTQGKTLKGQVIEENSMTLQGTARSNADLASFLTQLSGQPLFEAVHLKYSRTDELEKVKRVTFHIECQLSKMTDQ